MSTSKFWRDDKKNLGWDDPIPAVDKQEWVKFFSEMFDLEDIVFSRCVKPTGNEPILILFSDGSEKANGSCAYLRWQLNDGSFESTLLCAKSRVAPLKTLSIVRLELNGALLSKRLKMFIRTEMRIKFARVYFLTDSEVVLAMLQKESYRFHSYAAVRIGEIQQCTQLDDWYWI